MIVSKHPVIFLGAGPGDPELITVKGQRALKEAELIIYAGSLVPKELLKWSKPGVSVLNSASMHLEQIIDAMVEGYAGGKRVVRLHTGDPSLYVATLEQMLELERRNVPYAVIPGVTAAFAAAAALGIEFTVPDVSQTLIFTRMAGRTSVPEPESLASLASHKASMVIYLSMKLVEQVEAVLRKAYGDRATCAVVFRASQPEEKIIVTTLKDLSRRVKEEKITRHALILVGKVLDVRREGLKHKSKLYDPAFHHSHRRKDDTQLF
ncbi:MAG: precorrin-4 C(11)-methyltransferase [Deltaproteobacteria bacterium]|nr:precorrin-4 C(11)-methyltransferase [Deltaproteobacteria bacterium]